MWRRTYLALLLIRVYFALSPSYLHPDEVFQGPEIIAGSIFHYPAHKTWEWTTVRPIRSLFPLWLFYGLPMHLLKSFWTRDDGLVEPAAIYNSLRLVMFVLSFVLEDWAIHELVHSPKRRNMAVVLVASSYVTWTFQTHTFSNAIETLMVLWSLVIIDRIVQKERTPIGSCIVLGFLLVLGFFNRITFPAFIVIPGLRLLPLFLRRPFSFLALLLSIVFWASIAVAMDTAYYAGPAATASFRALFTTLRNNPVITPVNNILYNTQTSNLAQHGLHPPHQHILINLPQLLGPANLLLLAYIPYCYGSKLKAMLSNPRLTSAATGTLILSLIPHQEPRFLLPTIPLLLTCLRLPTSRKVRKYFWISWAIFNAVFSVLMGVYHQGGIVPAQSAMPTLISSSLHRTGDKADTAEVYWWKTYPPPTYLLGSNHTNPSTNESFSIATKPLMGMNQTALLRTLDEALPACVPSLLDKVSEALRLQGPSAIYLAAPLSAWRLDAQSTYPPASNFALQLSRPDSDNGDGDQGLKFEPLASFRRHLNLDDMDWGDDGVIPTLTRVVGRRGLGVWHVSRVCEDDVLGRAGGDHNKIHNSRRGGNKTT